VPDDDTLQGSFYVLEDIFSQAAKAVILAQKQLDGELGKDYLASCELASHRMLYSIPRTEITFGFGLALDQATKKFALLPWRKNSRQEQLHTHKLRFDLDAVPDPPKRPAPATPASVTTPLPFNVREPYFLLSPQDETGLRQKLISALKSDLPYRWSSAVPDPGSAGGVKQLTQDEVRAEAAAIDKVSAPPTPLEKPKEVGMVYFRYAQQSDSYLIVRVTEKSRNDSVFVLADGPVPHARIYSLDGDDTNQMSYEPLHDLAMTVRSWLLGQLPGTPFPASGELLVGDALQQLGLQYLQPFALSLRAGYARCIAELSGEQVGQTSDTLMQPDDGPSFPTFYDLTNVSAELSYSVAYNHDTPQFNFAARTTIDGQTFKEPTDQTNEYKLIESRVLIRASNENGHPRVDIELATPEFVLAEASRAAFLNLVAKSTVKISEEFGNNQVTKEEYRAFLEDKSRQPGVVALLAYKGKVPKEEFLVIWPGSYRGQALDFVFTCKRKDDQLDDIKALMRLDQNLAGIELGVPANDQLADAAPFAEKQYQAFHNFFHAVRIWRARVDLST
jgi:hypothetical protein